MDKININNIIKGATYVQYGNEYTFCQKVIHALMSVVPTEKILEPKEVEIVGVMCKLCIEGKDYMKNAVIAEGMEVCDVKAVQNQVLHNYKSSIKEKGWLVGKQFNVKMMQAIRNRSFSIVILHNADGRGS